MFIQIGRYTVNIQNIQYINRYSDVDMLICMNDEDIRIKRDKEDIDLFIAQVKTYGGKR